MELIIGQPPLITLQPGLGVPPSCLADFFEAVDRHMQRLEADLAFHLGQVHFFYFKLYSNNHFIIKCM